MQWNEDIVIELYEYRRKYGEGANLSERISLQDDELYTEVTLSSE